MTIFRNFDVKTGTNKVMLQLYSPSYHDNTLPSPSPQGKKNKENVVMETAKWTQEDTRHQNNSCVSRRVV